MVGGRETERDGEGDVAGAGVGDGCGGGCDVAAGGCPWDELVG